MPTRLRSEPLVSIVTPVFNNAENLPECIESILNQTYSNWEYTILNNCSTDGSGDVARGYAATDARIRVVDAEQFLRAVPNHNRALRQISPDSKYCKIVFADDFIFPECLERMVEVAERYPSVAIVGCYSVQNTDVMWTGLPYPSPMISGRDVCRLLFLKDVYVFGTATSLLYRSDIVRAKDPFYNESNLHADMETCVEVLKDYDFGFVHQVLSFKRVREKSLGALTEDINTLIAGHLRNLIAYGAEFLTPQELTAVRARVVKSYYNFLAVSALRGRRDARFWRYHRQKLEEAGVGFSRKKLTAALLSRALRAIMNPHESIEKWSRTRAESTTSSIVVNPSIIREVAVKHTDAES